MSDLTRVVVDASVVLGVALREETRLEIARRSVHVQLVASPLLPWNVLRSVRRGVGQGLLSERAAREVLKKFEHLPYRMADFDREVLLLRALDCTLTIEQACLLEVARRFRCPLLTLDPDLRLAALEAGRPVVVRSEAELVSATSALAGEVETLRFVKWYGPYEKVQPEARSSVAEGSLLRRASSTFDIGEDAAAAPVEQERSIANEPSTPHSAEHAVPVEEENEAAPPMRKQAAPPGQADEPRHTGDPSPGAGAPDDGPYERRRFNFR